MVQAMKGKFPAEKFCARFADLLLTIEGSGGNWIAHVEEVGYPDNAFGSTEYPTAELAKQEAISIARELFGTGVTDDLAWLPAPTHSSF